MRRIRAAALAVLAALPLAGCAASPVAGTAIETIGRSQIEPPPTVASPTGEFSALVDHVRQRGQLWREGAPINSLVLDDKQSVLNPVAVDCQRRQPVVLIDADPAATGPLPSLSNMQPTTGWAESLAAIRSLDVGIVWVTSRPSNESTAFLQRLRATGLDPLGLDTMAAPEGQTSKQRVRLAQARDHCVLAVVGDTRGDADEAYDYLRSAETALPIDINWGAGWFLLPAPLSYAGAK
jgi:hypothetical protein